MLFSVVNLPLNEVRVPWPSKLCPQQLDRALKYGENMASEQRVYILCVVWIQ